MRILYIALPMLLASAVYAADVRQPRNPDADCKKTSECVIVENGGCSGGWLSVNKKHEAQYIKRAYDMNSAIDCAHMPPTRPKPRAVCLQNTCTTLEKR